MKIITVNSKGSFDGAILPLGRTDAGQYHIRAPHGQGPTVAMDLLLSHDARVFSRAELLLSRASVEQDNNGHLQLVPQVSANQNQSEENAVLLWIPHLKDSVEVNPFGTVGGVSIVIENVIGTCDRLCAGGLVRLTAGSSFMLATYHNLSGQHNERRQLASVQVQFSKWIRVAGELPNLYRPKWA